MSEDQDQRPKVAVSIAHIEKLAMAIDLAHAGFFDLGTRLPVDLPLARMTQLFPDHEKASPQEVSMLQAIVVLEFLFGNKVIVEGAIQKGSRPRKPPPLSPLAQKIEEKRRTGNPYPTVVLPKTPVNPREAVAVAHGYSRKCTHCGLTGLKGKTGGKCVWCGEKSSSDGI